MKLWHPSWIGFLGTLLAALATVWAVQLSQSKDAERNRQVNQKNEDLIAANRKLTQMTEEINRNNLELLAKSERLNQQYAALMLKTSEVAQLSERLRIQLTGGDARPVLLISVLQDSQKIHFDLISISPNALFNVTVEIIDRELERLLTEQNPNRTTETTDEIFKKTRTTRDPITLFPSTTVRFDYPLPADRDKAELLVRISAINGEVRYFVFCQRNHDKLWLLGTVRSGSDAKDVSVSDPYDIVPGNHKQPPPRK